MLREIPGRCPASAPTGRRVVEGFVVVTKDSDFVDSFWLKKSPKKLLLVSTGNIPNNELLALFESNAREIESALTTHSFIELTRASLTVHA